VTGKLEAHATPTDGQVSYSKGGFAHVVRTDAGTPFHNFTIELLKPQGAPRNRCVKVIPDGALDCPQATAALPDEATTLVLETDEVTVRSGEASALMRVARADTNPTRLFAVHGETDLRVAVGHDPTKASGELIWMPAGTAGDIPSPSPCSVGAMLLTFQDSAPK
jgi:hypothetical protein